MAAAIPRPEHEIADAAAAAVPGSTGGWAHAGRHPRRQADGRPERRRERNAAAATAETGAQSIVADTEVAAFAGAAAEVAHHPEVESSADGCLH